MPWATDCTASPGKRFIEPMPHYGWRSQVKMAEGICCAGTDLSIKSSPAFPRKETPQICGKVTFHVQPGSATVSKRPARQTVAQAG